MIELVINGERRSVRATSPRELLRELGLDEAGRGLAIAIGDVVVPRSRWDDARLERGQTIEIVGAAQGG